MFVGDLSKKMADLLIVVLDLKFIYYTSPSTLLLHFLTFPHALGNSSLETLIVLTPLFL